MNRTLIVNIVRFILLALIQVLVLKRVNLVWGDFRYVHLLIYPLFIILLPLKTNETLVVFLGFLMGLTMDIFYDSIGVHASALVFTAFIRKFILKVLEPFEGYHVEEVPSAFKMGFLWFLSYSSILMVLHLLFYFSVEAFSFVYYVDIILKTIFSFVFSLLLILIHQLIFRTKH